MNKRQTILLIIIIIAIVIYCWILFFELPDKTVQEQFIEYIEGGRLQWKYSLLQVHQKELDNN